MEKRNSLPFVKKIRVRNFTVLKYTKALKSNELKKLRHAQGIPAEVQKHLQRGGLPYIKVQTLAENWAVEFICGSTMYMYIDTRQMMTEEGHENELTEDSLNALHNLFVMMYADCTVFGDTEYLENKAKNLQDYMNRRKAAEETPEKKAEDDKTLEELKIDEEAKANIMEMANNLEKKGCTDGE